MKYRPPKIIQQKLLKKQADRKFWLTCLVQAGLFSSTAALALLGAYLTLKRQTVSPEFSFQDFLIMAVVAIGVIVLAVFQKKIKAYKALLYKGIFMLVCFGGGMAVLSVFLPVFGAIAVIGVLLFFWNKQPTAFVHNLLLVVSLSGLALLGLQFSTATFLVLLLLVSFYEFGAVYLTNHKEKIIKDITDKKLVLGFLPVLGIGSVLLPLLFAVSLVPVGLVKSVVVAFFALIGILLSYTISEREKVKTGIPALPTVAFCAIVGYMVTLFW